MSSLLIIGGAAVFFAALFAFALCRIAADSDDLARRQWKARERDDG